MLTPLRAHLGKLSLVNIMSLALLALIISGCGGSTTVTPTPTSTIKFTRLNLGIPQQALNATITGPLPASQLLHIGVTFKVNQAAIDQWNQTNKNNHVTQGTVDATTIANSLGITDAQYRQMQAFFGLKNVSLTLNKLHTYLAVSAKVATVNALFHTRIVLHELNGRFFYTPDPSMPPVIPTLIAPYIVSITGLDNYSTLKTGVDGMPVQQASSKTQSRSGSANCNPDPSSYNTNQIASAYGYNQFWKHNFQGQGMRINLVEIDSFLPQDILNYAQCVNYNQKNIRLTTVDGLAALDSPSESTLDLDMLMGLAPQASIVDYQTGLSSDQGVNDALQQIINDNAKNVNSGSVVSISLGEPESGSTTAGIDAINSSLQQLVDVEHMTVFVATGDCAAFSAGVFGDLGVQFPSTDPFSVAVGGTEWVPGANGNLFEAAWSNNSNTSKCSNSWGSGGGLSAVFKRPQYQTGVGVNNKYSDGARQVPDVSALANQIAIYDEGVWTIVGGTSAATPIWAAGMALVNEAMLKDVHGYYYGPGTFYMARKSTNHYQAYNDVQQGNNLFYPATADWDYATGWGSPNLVGFFNVLLTDARSG